MKTTWGIAAALLLVAAAAMDTSARGRGGKQGFHGHGKRSGHQGSLVEQLGLSDAQQTQIQALKEDLREQGRALGEQYWTGFEAILTDEQRDALAESRNPLGLSDAQQAQVQALKEQDLTKEERRAGFAAILTADQRTALAGLKTNRSRHGRRGEHIEQLGLSDAQQAQVQALKEDLNEQRQALGEQYWTGFAAILTDEQRTTFEEIKANRGSHSKGSETAAAGKATTAVGETSWGRVKESFGR